jgi:hypothetical protein
MQFPMHLAVHLKPDYLALLIITKIPLMPYRKHKACPLPRTIDWPYRWKESVIILRIIKQKYTVLKMQGYLC